MGFAAADQLGNYRVIRPLGEGGMATVYEVEHVKLGVRYALKTFALQEGHVELFRKRFAAEGKIFARLNHPNVLRVIGLDIVERTNTLYHDEKAPRLQAVLAQAKRMASAGREKPLGVAKSLA